MKLLYWLLLSLASVVTVVAMSAEQLPMPAQAYGQLAVQAGGAHPVSQVLQLGPVCASTSKMENERTRRKHELYNHYQAILMCNSHRSWSMYAFLQTTVEHVWNNISSETLHL